MTAITETSLAGQLCPHFEERELSRLTSQQRADFHRNGFLVIEDALAPDEIAHYRKVVARLDQTITENYAQRDKCQPRRPGEHLELRNAVAHAEELLDLMVHPTTFPLLVELMSGKLTLTTSHVFLRPRSPEEASYDYKQIGWHRDGQAQVMPGEPRPWLYTKIGYFLTDTTLPDCGALRVVPGSHRYDGPAPAPEPTAEPYGAIEVRVKAGTAVIFENRLFHAVGPNFTDLTRENIYLGYCWRFIRPIDFVEQPESLKALGSPIQRQLLGQASSALGYFLPCKDEEPLVPWREALLAS